MDLIYRGAVGGLERQYWWVSQGYNHDLAIEQGTLWSLPKKGRVLPDRQLLLEMQPGDVVLHYADQYLRAVSVVSKPWRPSPRPEGYRMRPGDGDEGWLVEVDVRVRGLGLPFREIATMILAGAPGPLDKNGTPRQIYVARLDEGEAMQVLEALGLPVLRYSEEGLMGLPATHWDDRDTDSEVLARIRTEQGHLRRDSYAGG